MRIAVAISALLLCGCATSRHESDSRSTIYGDALAGPEHVQARTQVTGSEYSPEAWVAWQTCCKVKEGMSQAEVYAILPSAGRFKIHDSHEVECWFIVFENVGKDHLLMTVEYGADGRVIHIDRNIEHGINPGVPGPIQRLR